jgi:hypothetical protein
MLAASCSDAPLELGSDIVWKADHETGDLSAWTHDSLGGPYLVSSDSVVEVSSERAHTGRFSVKMTGTAGGTDGGGGLQREQAFPTEAYYSAWYYVPEPYKTITGYGVMRFAQRSDPTTVLTIFVLDLFSRPSGDLELRVTDRRSEYLQAPLADPPPLVPTGRWFQIEAFYRNASDGRFIVWIDGLRRYDIARPTGTIPSIVFAVCAETNALEPTSAVLFADDVAISYTRATPQGILGAVP